MARKSRKGAAGLADVLGGKDQGRGSDYKRADMSGLTGDSLKETKSLRVGLYARLSNESELNRERNTIENQMELLRSYARNHDDMQVVQEYYDISQTGTDFDRQGFENMMQDIRFGRINCVIVKDLSRLGRNYVEAGNYVERVFPFFGVRFIAVNDNYDSLDNNSNILLGFSNIYNEYYSRDISKKIRTALRSRNEKGEYIAAAPYGLMKDPADKHKVIHDPETVDVVRRIYSLYLSGNSINRIASILSADGVIRPSDYKNLKNNRKVDEASKTRWGYGVVRDILTSRAYMGDLVFGKRENHLFVDDKQHWLPKKDWKIVESVIEPVISREDFEKVQEIMAHNKKKWHEEHGPVKYSAASRDMLKGHIFCADCGAAMGSEYKHGKKYMYACGRSRRIHTCTSHHISMETVEETIMSVLHTQIVAFLDDVRLIRSLKSSGKGVEYHVAKEIRRVQGERNSLMSERTKYYEDYTEGLLDEDHFKSLTEESRRRESELDKVLADLTDKKNMYQKNASHVTDWEKKIESYKNKRKLTREMVETFVDKVYIGEGGKIKVVLAFDDCFELLDNAAKESERK